MAARSAAGPWSHRRRKLEAAVIARLRETGDVLHPGVASVAPIESALHGHPAVGDCAVFGVPDAAHGEAVVAAVARCGPVDADELIQLVADQLAAYKRPSQVIFVPAIPRLPSGKVLRRVLKERLWTSV